MSYETPVVCRDCESVIQLHETPFREHHEYVLGCECTHREIDVSAVVSSSVLVEPMTGKWSNFDVDSEADTNIKG